MMCLNGAANISAEYVTRLEENPLFVKGRATSTRGMLYIKTLVSVHLTLAPKGSSV